MGLFDRWRAAPEEPWSPPPVGSCTCEQHVENLREVSIPGGGGASTAAVTVAELLDGAALVARLAGLEERFVELPTGQRTGPYQWVLELSGKGLQLFDDDAPVQLDDCLAVQPGVERVAWIDPGRLAVGAPAMCPSGIQASLVTALTNPRVRRPA